VRLTRRALLGTAAVGATSIAALRLALPRVLAHPGVGALSPEHAAFVARCFEGLQRERLWDTHVHVVGLGVGGTGCSVSPEMQSHRHPLKRLQYEIYLAASGVTDEGDADRQYLERLLALHRDANPTGKLVSLAFDLRVDEAGREESEPSSFHTPNEYILSLAEQYEEIVPCASVHPYREDAVERLDACLARGARAVKWLPNAMAIDPASELCDAFYERLAQAGVPLISHAGKELAVDGEGLQELGNPLRLRRALDAGVRVIVAHCASLGTSLDLDAKKPVQRSAYELFKRVALAPEYDGRVFGDISALNFTNRSEEPLRDVLGSEALLARMVNGSDYPLPAIDPVVSTWKLVRNGFLSEPDRESCNAVFEANPLLFDFVLKRCLRRDAGSAPGALPAGVFETARLFEPEPA